MRSTGKVILLVIILGVPVFWYLFLQAFGENEFELEVLETSFLKGSCKTGEITLLYTDEPTGNNQKNQFSRIKQIARSNGIVFDKANENCIADSTHKLFLIDWKNDLRGKYTYEILEVDRAVVEIDLLKLLEKKNGPGN